MLNFNFYQRRKVTLVLAAVVILALAACDQDPRVSVSATGQIPQRKHDEALVKLGADVFKQHCAQCHGAQAQGDPTWRTRTAEGKFPPPPLNGTGHAWHHSVEVLRNVIENGSLDGSGAMPAWKNKLSDREISAAITWFQSLWPDQVYAAWYEMQQRK